VPSLTFSVEGADVVRHAASPLVALKVCVANAPADEEIQSLLVSCQVRIDAERRSYAPDEQAKLTDLFGEPAHWGRSLRGLLWTHAAASVPSFHGNAHFDVQLPCSFDLSAAWAKYFHALGAGEIPLTLQFSGTAFYQAGDKLQVARIPWDREARFPLKVEVWKDMMKAYYPNTAFLPLRVDVLDRLYRYKVDRGLPTWDDALESLLSSHPWNDPSSHPSKAGRS
jgi:Family of unknown function (DUF6084)